MNVQTQREAGFTLLETLVAFLILSGALAAYIQLTVMSVNLLKGANDRWNANAVAEAAASGAANSSQEESLAIAEDSRPVDLDAADGSRLSLQFVTVSVRHGEDGPAVERSRLKMSGTP